jgi:hypothetical protein
VGLVAAMSVQGLANLSAQRAIVGEYSDVQLEEMLEWINANVPPTGVFAGTCVPPVLRIRDVYPRIPGFFHPGSMVKKMPDPVSGSAPNNLSTTLTTVSKLSEI